MVATGSLCVSPDCFNYLKWVKGHCCLDIFVFQSSRCIWKSYHFKKLISTTKESPIRLSHQRNWKIWASELPLYRKKRRKSIANLKLTTSVTLRWHVIYYTNFSVEHARISIIFCHSYNRTCFQTPRHFVIIYKKFDDKKGSSCRSSLLNLYKLYSQLQKKIGRLTLN